ncbi:bifunctional 5,10-methylenetetrahydrofolate dehydrogenase/5,10-methenyltetrahydrofolate cyclohydrolase [Metamycoplasma phocicerebrale]|uniref:Bifunctional protein FolD n=1 Tax=Metamycoplasma phocicerebrale TaxID=142649 RepID=A0A3Q9V980_9BACT|nr:bifunctional 5,10-methylenetetrahydrofolate dehydrogenase/5,10-methenyltetrahydrofolate cyclohydrolase [Metamycoplasma phocicerebrale]AZZ65512.1 bifunctional 5,10-methylenetetrahydrofolate dehydrogenase/5,10-methenyltetrahydrofolate cyclohydrolase [Metamycoplasma phocicerebrale]
MYKILDGKKTSELIMLKIKRELKKLADNNMPILGILQVGNLEESNIYIKHKLRAAKNLGIKTKLIKLDSSAKEKDIINSINELEKNTTGFIIQLPMQTNNKINVENVLNKISNVKDIDGLNDFNQKANYIINKNAYIPATDLGIILLLKEYNIDFNKKEIGVVGQSKIVGKPLSNYFEQLGNVVRRYDKYNSKTDMHLNDIVIVATGVRDCLQNIKLKNNVILIDVGIHRLENNKITGDVNIENIKTPISYCTPVPGGVGPMTIVGLLLNLIKSYDIQNNTTMYFDIINK